MGRLEYTPDEDIKVHEENAIRLLCKGFMSHENGLPEWLKNSADAYARENAPERKRVIMVIFDSTGKAGAPSISCLDFCGMTSGMIEENFRVWADPDAALRGGRAQTIQGGHGNGGKCYMTQMFEGHAMINTVKKGMRSRYGVAGKAFRFGYIPDRETGRDYPTQDLIRELEGALDSVNCTLNAVMRVCEEAVGMAEGFTLVTGVGAKGYKSKIPSSKLIENLEEHTQMVRTLEMCRVYTVVDGHVSRKALRLPPIKPIMGVEGPKEVVIPGTLVDPMSEEEVSTIDEGTLAEGVLRLLTSDVSMRWKKKGRHVVSFKTKTGYIGTIQVHELDVYSSYRDQIYGSCHLDALEPFKRNDRGRLAPSPLVRAVESFISKEVQQYCEEFETRDKRIHDRAEKNAISRMNEALDRWKNRFLNDLMKGLWGTGGEGPEPARPSPLPIGKPGHIELSLTHPMAGVGVSFRPTVRFFDKTGQRIRPTSYRWVSEDNNVAMVDEDLMIISTFAHGRTVLHAETLDGKVRSNDAPLHVIRIHDIRLLPTEVEIPIGSRQRVEAFCRVGNGEESSDVYLEWTEDDPNVARVSSAGLVFGFALGETSVVAGDDKCEAKEPATVKVVSGKGRGKGSQHGRGYPLVLVSGEIDRDPDTEEYRHFSREVPPVWQDAMDAQRNIWWINSAAPLAKLYLDKSTGYGYESMSWRMYHIERYIDVIVQIALTHGPTEEKELFSADEWIMKWGYQVAEIQAAAAADLADFISTGRLPD